MAYTSKSNQLITNAPKFNAPLSEATLVSGAMFAEQNAQQAKAETQAGINSILGIQAISEADQQVLSQRQQELQDALSNVSMSNLSNPQSVSQINGIINKFSTDKDILAIAQRSAAVQKELATKKDYESKGKQYVSPILDQADEYTQSGNYYRDKRFNQSGWVSPDTTKAMQDAVKMATKTKRNPKTGIVEKIASPEDVSSTFYTIMQNDPNYQRDLQYSFQRETKDVNWDDKGQEFVQEKMEKLQQQYEQAVLQGDVESAEMAAHELKRVTNLSNPALIGSQLKEQYFKNYINTQLEQVGYAADVSDFEKIERDPIDLKLYEHQLQRQDDIYKLQLKTGVFQNKGESQQAYIQRLADAAQTKDIEIAQARQDIKTDAAKDLDDYKTANKVLFKTKTGEVLKIKSDGAKQIQLNGEFVDKKAVEDQIMAKDKNIIEQFLNSKKQIFGLGDETVDPETWGNGGIRFNENGDIVYNNDVAGAEEEFTVPITELVKSLYDNTHIPVVKNKKGIYVNHNPTSEGQVDKSTVKTLTGKEDPRSLEIGEVYELNGKDVKWDGKNLIEQ